MTPMASKILHYKPCKTCCISDVCIQSVISAAKCPATKPQLNSLYGTMMHPKLNADKHTEPNKSFT